MNRLFDEPLAVFNEKMLKPELQDMDVFVDGINNIVEAQQRVALKYFEDGSVEAAIPPLKILLHIMAYGNFNGKDLSYPELRREFERDYVLQTDWYKNRLKLKQEKDAAFLKNQISYLENFKKNPKNENLIEQMQINQRIQKVNERLGYIESDKYIENITGTIGADILYKG
jgi:heterodisulfide reductase subunit C